jgi:electron transport complex protein RnfG
MEEKGIVRTAVPLIMICLVSGALLSVVNDMTADRIKAVEAEKINESLSFVFPGGTFEPREGYYVVTVGGEEAGYAFIAEGKGFSSTIKSMVGLYLNGTVNRVVVLNQLETPGLGARVSEPGFASQFQGNRIADVRLRQDGGVIDGITGATISSRAMTNSIREEGLEVLNDTRRAD